MVFFRDVISTLDLQVKDVIPDDNVIVLDKGDLEDYYPREIQLKSMLGRR